MNCALGIRRRSGFLGYLCANNFLLSDHLLSREFLSCRETKETLPLGCLVEIQEQGYSDQLNSRPLLASSTKGSSSVSCWCLDWTTRREKEKIDESCSSFPLNHSLSFIEFFERRSSFSLVSSDILLVFIRWEEHQDHIAIQQQDSISSQLIWGWSHFSLPVVLTILCRKICWPLKWYYDSQDSPSPFSGKQ